MLFCDQVTKGIKGLVNITDHRRRRQLAYNEQHGITPQSVRRAVQESLHATLGGEKVNRGVLGESGEDLDVVEVIGQLQVEMNEAAARLEFEKAALLRDQIGELKAQAGDVPQAGSGRKRGR